ncbi:A disintegrin and metalloproteinase with thrombospondin motifs 9-like [Ischnura elegans]|uniref:A disintegrin and metalloproteinase with thrombospondin motifs 9-like n=1 Tax=Ischnura elegans TaxID=197161 RepID=UPI001ED867DB|nr:A disintegrin and metalloproteinase with thrombospondin motifs 9-like [Ischnura elegans]
MENLYRASSSFSAEASKDEDKTKEMEKKKASCSVTCGTGEQGRPYWCELEGKAFAEAYCCSLGGDRNDGIPVHVQPCNTGPCSYSDIDNWIQEEGPVLTTHPSLSSSPLVSPSTGLLLPCTPPPSTLIECSETCGEEGERSGGYVRRLVACQDEYGRDANDSHCSHSEKPRDVSLCPKCSHGEWGPYSTTCGIGDQQRRVTCHKVSRTIPADSDQYDSILENPGPPQQHYCSAHHKPAVVQGCQIVECPIVEYRWKTGKWKACSKPCGWKGKQRRLLSCVWIKRDGQMEPASKQLSP